MFNRLIACVLFFGVWTHGGRASEAADKSAEKPPDFFKVFSHDGSESLTATCKPQKGGGAQMVPSEVDCRFTHVRFQGPSTSQSVFPLSLEEAVKDDKELATKFSKDPAKTRREWAEGMDAMRTGLCSTGTLDKFRAKIASSVNAPKRRRPYENLVQACSDKTIDVMPLLHTISEPERTTCSVWVDHFSLTFKRVGDRNWLFTQEQPAVGGTLKVYELATERDYPLWTLTETRMIIGQQESTPERKTWSWKNWDNYELPEDCQFMSHNLIQY